MLVMEATDARAREDDEVIEEVPVVFRLPADK